MVAVPSRLHGQQGISGAAQCEVPEGGGQAGDSRGVQATQAGLLRGPRQAEQPEGSRQVQIGYLARARRRQARRGWTRRNGFSERGSQIPYESTSGPQWPHNGLTMATQWPLVFSQVAPTICLIQKII